MRHVITFLLILAYALVIAILFTVVGQLLSAHPTIVYATIFVGGFVGSWMIVDARRL